MTKQSSVDSNLDDFCAKLVPPITPINKLNCNSNGQLFVVSAPSGTGKTTLVQQLRGLSGIGVSISYTTRLPRSHEQDGVDYHFTDVATFDQMIQGGNFLECAQVFGNYYGTSRATVIDMLNKNLDVILEIDYQGALQVFSYFPEAISIYIVPPSPDAQRDRLSKRGQDSPDVIENRLRGATKEIVNYKFFDYLVVNDNFERAIDDMKAIVTSYRLQRKRQERCYLETINSFLSISDT